MAIGQLENTLMEIELQLAAVSSALIQGQPNTLEQASLGLKELAVRFSGLVKDQDAAQLNKPELKSRIVALKNGLMDHRIHMIRRSASVDGALNSLIPSASPSTYATQSGRYGASNRQTGAFKVLAA